MRTLLTLVVLLVAAPSAKAQQKIGIILPLTGDFAYFGEDFRKGFELAARQFESLGSLAPEIVFEDDQCLAKAAVTAYKRLVDVSKVSLILGPACSTCINSLAPIARNHPIPTLFLLDTGEKVAALPDPLYSFGFDPPKMAKLLAEDAINNNFLKIGVITEDEEYSHLISDSFLKSFETLGGTVTIAETIPVNSPDVRSVLTKVLAKKPDAVFFSSAYQAGSFLRQLRLLNPTVPIYGNDTMCVADTIASAGAASNGARCGNVILDETNTQVMAFRSSLQTTYRYSPSSLFYAALGHDSFYLALKELGLISSTPTLLGVEKRRADGMYDIEPKILIIEHGKINPVRR